MQNDRRNEAVRQLQQWLRLLHRADGSFPSPVPNGRYDALTAEAVKTFQEKNGLAPTGEADAETWDALRAAAEDTEEMLSDPLPVFPFRPPLCGGELRPGERCDLVRIVQIMLDRLSLSIPSIPVPEADGVFDERTVRAVKEFQARAGLEATGRVDKRTWNRLADSYNAPCCAE